MKGYYFEDRDHAEEMAGRRTAEQWERRETKTTPRGVVSSADWRGGRSAGGGPRGGRRRAGSAFEFPYPGP